MNGGTARGTDPAAWREAWRPESVRDGLPLGASRAAVRTPYLRRPWTEGRIGGRTFKGGIFLILGILVYLLVLSDTGWLRQWRLQQRRHQLQAEIARLEAESAGLAAESQRLADDPSYRERIAREEWGYKRKDETVYHLRRQD